MKKPNRQETLGIKFADAIIEAAHQTYNAPRGRAIVESCIRRLQERLPEIQPRTADPKYKKTGMAKPKNPPAKTALVGFFID